MYVEVPQVQYIKFSEVVHVVKVVVIVISVHLNLSTLFVVSHIWSACPLKGGLTLVSGPRKCHFPLKRGVHSIRVTDKKSM